MRALIPLAALFVLACDARTDRAACSQYADTLDALQCGADSGGDVRAFCDDEANDSPCADDETSECVAFWDCLSQRATCDADARIEGNQTCAVANDLETQEDVRFD